MAAPLLRPLDFELPPELEAHDPPEARGRSRDDVRLMVATRHDLGLVHARFRDLPRFLRAGDLLVINTSRTLPASIPALRADGTRLELHLSTPVLGEGTPVDLSQPPDPARDAWLVELRTPPEQGGRSFRTLSPGERLELPEAWAEITGPYPPSCGPTEDWPRESRLWTARLRLPSPLGSYLERHGRPIRYGPAGRQWPASYYQTVYASEAGSVEMPSAGRPFTPEMITCLIAGGVDVAPITLHAGVASLEDHEPPLREYYRVPEETARRVMLTRSGGGRVIAVGTTVVRALETVTTAEGKVSASQGWTNVLVSPASGVRSVDGLLTGWHEPRASHLLMLEAVAGRELLERSYRAGLERGYLWHEFGDLHLILP
jgi:S-adenosylmethionine:tRNA ribosyltransferase-isomerase